MRRSRIPSLILGLTVCGLSGCLRGDVNPIAPVNVVKSGGDPAPADPSAFHPHPPPVIRDHEAVQPAHIPDGPPPGPFRPAGEKRRSAAARCRFFRRLRPMGRSSWSKRRRRIRRSTVAALRDLTAQNRSPDALEQPVAYDGASRDLLLTLLPLAAA